MKLEIRHGVDVGYFDSSLSVQNNMTHPDYPESKKGYPKDKTLEEMLVLAKDIEANIIIKAGKKAKWYLKHCPRHELDAEIEKRPRWKNSKNATMYIVEFEAESQQSSEVDSPESDGYSTPDELENDEEDSVPTVLTQQRTSHGCRDARQCFSDDQPIRHTIDEHSWMGTYVASENGIMHDGILYTGLSPLNQFTKAHYKSTRPDRVDNNNAWQECKCYVSGKWISTFNLPAI